MNKLSSIVSCVFFIILFLVFLVKKDIPLALFMLVLTFSVLIKEMISASQEDMLNVFSCILVAVFSIIVGIYGISEGNLEAGLMSFAAILFPAFGIFTKKSKN